MIFFTINYQYSCAACMSTKHYFGRYIDCYFMGNSLFNLNHSPLGNDAAAYKLDCGVYFHAVVYTLAKNELSTWIEMLSDTIQWTNIISSNETQLFWC